MSIVLNPSLAAQNGLAMIAALSCVEFIREIPIYANGTSDDKKSLFIKFLLAVIVVFTIMFIMFIYDQPGAHVPAHVPAPDRSGITAQSGSGVARF